MTNGRTFLGFLAVVCSMWCIGIALAFADEHRGESADNLLTNPGFEEMDQNVPVLPRGWSFLTQGVETLASTAAPEAGRTGGFGVKMTANASDAYRLWQTVPVEGDRVYEFSAWLKSDVRSGGRAYLTVEFYRDTVNKAGYRGSKHSENYPSFPAWAQVKMEAETPSDANLARVYLRMTGPGTVYYDDASFGEVGVAGPAMRIEEHSEAQSPMPDHHLRYVVQHGEANAVIVRQMPRAFGRLPWDEAIEHFQDVVHRSTGALIPVVTTDELSDYGEEVIRLVIGPGPLAISLGIDASTFEPETFRITAVDSYLCMVGDVRVPESTLWAVAYFLDRYVGVRWLWPGEVGTYVPLRDNIVFPEIDITSRPSLEKRNIRISALAPEEGRFWLKVHQMGSRSEYKFGHAFTNWWAKYGAAHPELFAMPPPGESRRKAEYVKLDVSNPAVDEMIMSEWKAARMPNNWSVCPNDSSGYCVTDGCLAMDDSTGHSLADIWNGRVSMTARYIRFWNRLYDQMKELNPNLTLSTYAYGAYREPPTSDIKLNDGIVIGIVNSWWAYNTWKGWYDAGAKLFLRPNWWHSGSAAPHIPLYQQGAYFRFALEHGMLGFDFDSLVGHWATQGPLYYLIARMSERPDLTVDDIIDEYVSAFGKAESAIRDYLVYWEWFSERAAYPADVGGTAYQDVRGTYVTELEKRDLATAPIAGSYRALPLLYSDVVIDHARSILERADRLAEDDSDEVRARIAFLKDGLTHLQLTRDVAEYGYPRLRPSGVTKEAFIERRQKLYEFRQQVSADHVVWGDALNNYEIRWGFPMHESQTTGW